MKRMGWRVALVIAGTLMASGCGLHGKPKVERRAQAAEPSMLGANDVGTGRIVAPGIVEPWGGNVEVSPRDSGWIAEVVAREGEHVAAGDVIAQLDDEREQAALTLARAELAEAEAALARTLHGATPEELRQVRAETEASRARAELAAKQATRSNRLGADAAIPAADVERAVFEAEASAAAVRANEARLSSLERGSRAEDRLAAASRVASSRARYALAEANLARRRVVAPTSGVVLLSRYHAGEFFSLGSGALAVLGDTSNLQVRVEVDEIDASGVSDGAPCTLSTDGHRELGSCAVVRVAPRMGRRGLQVETPTARSDVRVREVFVEANNPTSIIVGQRVWAHFGST